MAGRLAPFIELAVGFNPDLTARENVTPNGVMLGLSQIDAPRLLDAVLDFAPATSSVEPHAADYSSRMLCASPSL